MVELDHVKLAATYLSLRCMELALVGAGVGGRIKYTSKLKVLNYKKAMQSHGEMTPRIQEQESKIQSA